MSNSVDIDPTMDPPLKVFSRCLVVGFCSPLCAPAPTGNQLALPKMHQVNA